MPTDQDPVPDASDERHVGSGTPTYPFAPAVGSLRRFDSPQDVIASIDDDLESTIALVRSGGTTFLSPILGRLGGVLALDGTLRSHLAIVSREFEVACLVGTVLTEDLADGTRVRLEQTTDGRGTVSTADPVEAAADVSEQWWNYIRRHGDEIGVKAFDVAMTPSALDQVISETLTDSQLDELIQHMGRAFKPEITRRSAFTSELFPMLPYMCLSVIEDFHTYGERIRTIDAAMPAEEIGRRLRQKAGVASPLWTWMVAYHYLCGRECLVQMGKIERSDHIDDTRAVVDFWRRLSLAQRGDGTLDNKDAGFTNRYLPEAETDELWAQTVPVGPHAKVLKRLNATVSGYSFLYFTDSRVGIYDSGPYPVAGGREMLVRDYLCLQPSTFGYPWAADVSAPCAGLTLVLGYDPQAFTSFEVNDWGTTFTEPGPLLGGVSDFAVIAHDADGSRRLVDPAELPELTTALSKAHLELYQRFADMDRNGRIWAATTMYCWGLKPLAALAGVTEEIDWSISDRTLALYPDPLGDDQKAAVVFGTAVVANDMPGSFSPLH